MQSPAMQWEARPLRALLRLAGPIAVSMLSYSVMTLVDTIVVGLREVRYGQGDARSPMLASIAANLVNVALSTTFVFALGWGVAGVAAATAIAQSAEAAFLWLMPERTRVWPNGAPTRAHFAA